MVFISAKTVLVDKSVCLLADKIADSLVRGGVVLAERRFKSLTEQLVGKRLEGFRVSLFAAVEPDRVGEEYPADDLFCAFIVIVTVEGVREGEEEIARLSHLRVVHIDELRDIGFDAAVADPVQHSHCHIDGNGRHHVVVFFRLCAHRVELVGEFGELFQKLLVAYVTTAERDFGNVVELL